MTTRLMLLLDEHWPQQPAADWVLIDDRGRLLQQGRSAPAHWPAAAQCEAVLSGSQCTWLDVVLPPAPARDRTRLLAYALEEHLLGEVDTQHLTVTHARREDERRHTGVLVVARSRMAQLQAQFAALGRPLQHLRSLLQIAPIAPEHWTLALDGHHGAILRGGPDGTALACDLAPAADGHVQLAAVLALAAARQPVATPQPLVLRPAAGQTLPAGLLEHIAQLPAFAASAGEPWHWWQAADHAADLLHGDHAPATRRDLGQRLRAPAALAALALLTVAAVGLVHNLFAAHELAALDAARVRLLADTLPGTPAIDPARQLGQALERARSERGQLARADFLSLLHEHTEAGGPMPSALHYDNRRLGLVLPAGSAARLTPRLSLRGIAAAEVDGHLLLTPAARP